MIYSSEQNLKLQTSSYTENASGDHKKTYINFVRKAIVAWDTSFFDNIYFNYIATCIICTSIGASEQEYISNILQPFSLTIHTVGKI